MKRELRSVALIVALVRYPGRTNGWGLHSRYVLIDAPYSGSAAHRRLVFTGSHNWTGPSLDQNDETLLRVENDAVFDAFAADHARARRRGEAVATRESRR
jgi:phosphatidylserine/phosphatidylglycerophosphate/cardiolipin synthase-like enzyme